MPLLTGPFRFVPIAVSGGERGRAGVDLLLGFEWYILEVFDPRIKTVNGQRETGR